MTSTPLIELKNVSLNRGDIEVFRGLNLSLPQNVHSLILGPNGAGKSSLIKLILRDIYPLAREDPQISILGDSASDVLALRRRFGVVSDELQHRFEGTETGLQVVASGFYASIGTWQHQRFDKAQLDDALRLMQELGVSNLAERTYKTLSTGQQRRLLLARALVHDPDYLLMDEPTSGLDPEASFHYLDLVRDLMQRGKYLVLVTHHIHEIPSEIEHVFMLKSGELFAQGKKDELLNSKTLSDLYGFSLELVERNGIYQVFPAPNQDAFSKCAEP